VPSHGTTGTTVNPAVNGPKWREWMQTIRFESEFKTSKAVSRSSSTDSEDVTVIQEGAVGQFTSGR